MLLELTGAAFGGSVITLVTLFFLGRRRQRRTGHSAGPNSRMPIAENVVPVVRKE